MTEYLGKKYVPVEQDFFEAPAELVAPRLIGCVLHHDNRGEDTAIMIAEGEAYSQGDREAHCHLDAPLHVRTRGVSQLLPPGHAYIHGCGNMLFLDLVCDTEGRGSSVLICAAVPVAGIDIMTERRSTDPSASRDIRNRTKGFEKHLCKEPCNVGKALGLYEALDGASLFKRPFRLYRPIEPVTTLLNGPRANIAKGVDLFWRWGHADYKEWLSPPAFPKNDAK